jgi:CBS domain containing-hemolysin-like protein
LSNPRPTPQPRPQPLTETELVTALDAVRRRLRERNKDHGRTSLRETMEVVRPGVAQGDIDDDYKAMIAEIRRLRSIAIVDEMDRLPTGMTEIVTMQGQDVEVAVFDRPES